jgi:hypothetical protein
MWSALLGVIVGAIVAYVPRFLTSSQKLKAYRSLLSVEIDKCTELASVYLRDNISSPSYRLPTLGIAVAFPQIIALARISQQQMSAIQAFYIEVDAMNRGLDQAEKRRVVLDDENMKTTAFLAEINRLKVKAENINRDYPAAKQAVVAIPTRAIMS